MNFKIPLALLVLLTLSSCRTSTREASVETWKQEILETERNFAEMAKREGVSKAFLNYAAEDAVLMRNNRLVVGKEALFTYFKNQTSANNEVSLLWEPDFVDVSGSGDLGYTYGHYTLSFIDSSGSRIENTGVFHTVWKRQPDNSWRFVWD